MAQNLPVVVVLKENQAEEHLILVQGPERGCQKTSYEEIFEILEKGSDGLGPSFLRGNSIA